MAPSRCEYFFEKNTHHHHLQLGDGVNERPDPLSMGLRVDGAVGSADDRAPRALLGVSLEEV